MGCCSLKVQEGGLQPRHDSQYDETFSQVYCQGRKRKWWVDICYAAKFGYVSQQSVNRLSQKEKESIFEDLPYKSANLNCFGVKLCASRRPFYAGPDSFSAQNRTHCARKEMPWTRRSSSNRNEIVHIVVTGYQKKKEPRKHYVSIHACKSVADELNNYLKHAVYTPILHSLTGVCHRRDVEQQRAVRDVQKIQ